MDRLVIEGGNRLVGDVSISGAKNAVLPLMAGGLLLDEELTITNVPALRDIRTFTGLLSHTGSAVSADGDTLRIRTEAVKTPVAPYEMVKTMRASILALGPLLGRFHKAKVSLPGGCAIGARPVNLHIDGLRRMGATVEIEHGYIIAEAKKGLRGDKIYLELPSVTGTENLMLAAVYAEGETIIENAALEPEVVFLADALVRMGADITGAGTERIVIKGVTSLKAATVEVIPDRVEAGTFMIAAAMTEGNVLLKNCPMNYLDTLVAKLREAGASIEAEGDGVRVVGKWPIKSVDVKTLPYPGFPTDMQAQIMAMMTISGGLSVIRETVFENRFMHVGELRRMGADISVDGRCAIIRGVSQLGGAPLMATDLRASASLVLAGLVAAGQTEISRIYHLDRGYDGLEKKLAALGAQIKRVHDKKE